MSVSFGPTAQSVFSGDTFGYAATGFTVAIPAVTSGQPIILTVLSLDQGSLAPTISDDFSTSYTYTLVDTAASLAPAFIATYIATGGRGTSGTITVTGLTSGINGGTATPCIGASTASGTACIDVHGARNLPMYSSTMSTPSLAPSSSGGGAFFVGVADNEVVGPPYMGPITFVTGNGTAIIYTATNNLSAGDIVSTFGVTATGGGDLNTRSGIVASATSTYFTVASSVVGTAKLDTGNWSRWLYTTLTYSTEWFAGTVTYEKPPSGTALSPAWALNTVEYFCSAGLIMLPGAVPPPTNTGNFFFFFN